MIFAFGVATGMALAVVLAYLFAPRTTLQIRVQSDVRERIRKVQEIGENSLASTFANALALYEYAHQAKMRGATIWVHEPDGEDMEIEVK